MNVVKGERKVVGEVRERGVQLIQSFVDLSNNLFQFKESSCGDYGKSGVSRSISLGATSALRLPSKGQNYFRTVSM